MKTLTNITYPIIENCLSKNNKIEAKLLVNWSKIASEYGNVTFPKKIMFFNNKTRQGKLILSVTRGFGPVIQMQTPNLLNKINDFLGYKAIDEIKIEQII